MKQLIHFILFYFTAASFASPVFWYCCCHQPQQQGLKGRSQQQTKAAQGHSCQTFSDQHISETVLNTEVQTPSAEGQGRGPACCITGRKRGYCTGCACKLLQTQLGGQPFQHARERAGLLQNTRVLVFLNRNSERKNKTLISTAGTHMQKETIPSRVRSLFGFQPPKRGHHL